MKHSQDHTRGRSPQKQPVSRVSAKNRCIDNIDASIATNDSVNRPVGRLIRVQRRNRAKGEPDRYTSKHFVETDAFWGARIRLEFQPCLLPPGDVRPPRDRGVVFVQRHGVSAACGLVGIKLRVPGIPPVIASRGAAPTIAFLARVTA